MNPGQDSARPLIGVVVATLNAGSTLRKCLRSVAAQDSRPELIVMDGGSSDDTLAILEEFRDRISYSRSQRDRGVYWAWNDALDHVTAEWLYFLGSDDFLWTPDVFTRIAPVLRSAESGTQIVYGKVSVLDGEGRQVAVVGRSWPECSARFFSGGNLFHQGVFHRRTLFSTRRFDTSFRINSDYEFLLGAITQAPPVFEPIIVAGYHAGGISNRAENILRAVQESDRALRAYGCGWSVSARIRHYTGAFVAFALLRACSLLSKQLARKLARRLMLHSTRGA